MTNVDRNLGASEPWGRATEKEIEDLKKRLRKLEGGRQVQAKTQSILADLIAKASVQDQLLQSQIDAQDIVTYADGPPDLGINEPDDSDVSEEDPGPVTGDEVDFDPGTDDDDDDDAGVPWEPDDGTPPEPTHRWVQEDPLRGVIEGEWTLVDGVWEPRQVGSDYVADGAIIRDKIEQAVLDDIDEANSTANEAVIAANGKNTIYRGPNLPTPPSNGFNEGDTWFDTSGGDTTIKSWSGSAWAVQEVGTESLAVGAITAESGIIASLDAGVISTGTLNADRIDSRSITADKILVGESGNLLPGTWNSNQSTSIQPGPPGLVSALEWVPTGAGWTPPGLAGCFRTQPGQGLLSPVFDPNPVIPVESGESYLIEIWLRTASADAPDSRIFIELRDQNGNHVPGTQYKGRPTNPNGGHTNYVLGNFTVPTNWTKYTITFTPTTAITSVYFSGWYFNHANGTNRDATIGFNIRMAKQVGGTLIEDGAITTTKIAADAIEADHIKANAITAPKIGAGAVTARTLNVISEEDNRRLSILPDGIRLWGDSASGGDPNISLTTSGADYLSITSDGETVAGMDNEGIVVGKVLSAAEDVLLEGDSLRERMESQPQGVVARYERNIGGAALNATSGTDGRMEVLELTTSLEAGRVYEFKTDPIAFFIPTDSYVYLYVYYTIDGSRPTRSNYFGNRLLTYYRDRASGNRSIIPLMGSRFYMPSADYPEFRMMLDIRHRTTLSSLPTVQVVTGSAMGTARLTVIDHGTRTYDDEGVDRTGITQPTTAGGGGSDSGGNDPAPPKTYTNTWTANNSASYTGSGSLYSYAGRNVYQGYWLAANGNLRGLWTFPSAVWNTTSGSEVTKVRLYVKNSHSRWNGGLTAYFGTHARSTVANPGTTRSNGWTTKFAKGEGKWITLSGSAFDYFKSRLQGGNPVGMMIYTTGSDNYGYFAGAARIEVTYKK